MAQCGHFASRRNHLATIANCCLALALITSSIRVFACPVDNKTIRITANEHILTAEIAADRASHLCGLAFRHDLPSDYGMLFVYARDQTVGFWMKDTFIPLSIAFLDRDGRILEIHDMDPMDPTRRYTSRSPVRFALEVNRGWFTGKGIGVGDRLEFDWNR